MSTATKNRSMATSWATHCLLAILFVLAVACPARCDIASDMGMIRREGTSSAAVDLGRRSSAHLRQSERRIGSLRQVIDASRADRARKAAESVAISEDGFALGRRIDKPITLRVPTKKLHEKTIGRIRSKSFARYSQFDEYWRAAGSGTRGKFFESQSVLQANSALKKQGSPYRYAITAVEGDPGHPADVVLLDGDGRIVSRYQLKSTQNADDIIRFTSDPKYADMPIVTHPETVAELRGNLERELRKARRRGRPLPPKWQTLQHKLESGLITDELVDGKRVASYQATMENAKRFRLFQWKAGPIDVQTTKKASAAVAKSVAIPKALSRVGMAIARVAEGTFLVLEVVSAPMDIGFAAYGYYDTCRRYSDGALEEDLLVAKLAIHTTEAALGGVAVYSLGVGLGLIAAPETIVTKVTGVVVVVGSVVVLAADMAVSAVVDERDNARQQVLEVLTHRERYLAVRVELSERARLVLSN